MRSILLLIFIFVSIVYGNNEDLASPSSTNTWKNTAITSLFLLVIIMSIMAYIFSINKRLRRRIRSLEQICIDHGITKDKPYHYALSSDDEYDELNPFLTKSDLDKSDDDLNNKTDNDMMI
eukprot:278442_1